MHVPLLDLKRNLDVQGPALRDAFERVLQSGHYINGLEVEHFEREIAAFCEVSQAVGVSSGTDALLVTLMALGVGRGHGDEVICPSYSFFATAGSIVRTGARPVFVDSCPGCFNLLPHAVARAVSPRTRAVMPVHLFGQCAQMEVLQAALGPDPVPIIEDAAQAMGATVDMGIAKRQAGSVGRAGCFSFFPSKNLGALGDGGLVTTQDPDLAQRLRVLRNHGAEPKYHHALVGGNFRLDALQAAFLRVKLPTLHAATRARQGNAARYNKLFLASGHAMHGECVCESETADTPPITRAPITLPAVTGAGHTYNQYVIMFDSHTRREHVRSRLREQNIGCEVYYPIPLHRQACFANLEQGQHFPHAERAAECSLALPIFPGLTQPEIEHVATQVLRATAHVRAGGEARAEL